MLHPRRWIAFSAAGVLAAAGWLGAPQLAAMRSQAAASQAAQPGAARPQATPQSGGAAGPEKSVLVEKPRRMKMARKLDIPAATIEAYEQVEIAARIAGYVGEVKVEIGDRVREGGLLAVLEAPELEQELLEARAELEVARREAELQGSVLGFEEADFVRREALHAEGALPKDAFDAARRRLDEARFGTRVAQAEVELAAARVRRLETMLAFARIAAPFEGVVTKRLVDRGALVQAGGASRGSPLFVLHRTDRMRLAVEVPESDVAWIAPGATEAVAQPFAFAGSSLVAKVSRAASALMLSTRTMRVELDLDNADGRLAHGMAARVLFELDPRPDALTIPAAALLVEGGVPSVFVVEGERVVRRAVGTGLDDGVRLEVTKGLSEEDLVIVAGKGMVAEGARVRAVLAR